MVDFFFFTEFLSCTESIMEKNKTANSSESTTSLKINEKN